MEEGFCKGEQEPWRVLEFYSGIGGMRYAMVQAGVTATMVEAFDINNKANDVYQHNFAHRPYQGACLAPLPSLPTIYTPRSIIPSCLQKDSGDARASSFLKILDLIREMSMPPYMLFVENVVGFETSDTHKQMIEILVCTGFITQEYILTPLQFGVPYSRPRYFCLAKRKPSAFQNPRVNNKLVWSPKPLLKNDGSTLMDDHDESHERWKEWLQSCKPIENFLEFKTSSQSENADCNVSTLSCESSEENKYIVPLSLIERWGSAMDIVYPDSKRCCCFTKSYFRYVKGTGSLLAAGQPQEDKVSSLKEQGLRYFTPREVANLHSLPENFQFPPHISLKQQYALLGNSLSIAVVASLLHYLFTEPS